MAVITISRQIGTGREILGQKIAEKLDYTFANQKIIQKIAEVANVSENMVRLVETESGTNFSKLISKLVSMRHVERVLKRDQGYINERLYRDYLILVIAQIADEGNVVILGRGSQYILRDHPDAYHFLLVDNKKNRIKFVMENYNMSKSRAAHLVTNEDKRRINLYSKLGKKDFDDPSLYHLVLNMSKVSIDDSLDIICNMAKNHVESD